jgi:hypothetical protein
MPPRKPLTVSLPRDVADELADAARRTQRSVAFIVRRALGAAPNASDAGAPSERVDLALTTDEDDPPDTATKIKAAAKGRSLDDAIAAAWRETRARFHAWIAREEAAATAERADDLDTSLADAQAASTPVARLTALASSEYPKVRALVAIHPSTPPDVLAKLSQDKEPYVRDAVENRRLKG